MLASAIHESAKVYICPLLEPPLEPPFTRPSHPYLIFIAEISLMMNRWFDFPRWSGETAEGGILQ